MEALFELLFGGIFDQLFGGGTRREARRLKEVLNRAQAAGQPLACVIPASLRDHHQGQSLQRGWKRGTLRIEPTSLTWAPSKGGQPWDLTASTITSEKLLITSTNENLNSQKLIMQATGGVVEVVVRQPFLPFVHVGLEQTRTAADQEQAAEL